MMKVSVARDVGQVSEETCESICMLDWIDKTEDCGRLFIEEIGRAHV